MSNNKISGGLMLLIAGLSFSKVLKAQMEFVENKGQWHENVQYKGDFTAGNFFLEQKGFTVLLHSIKDLNAVSEFGHGEIKGPVTLHSFAYKVNLLGASDDTKIIPEKPKDSYSNFFIGDDQKKWASKCRIFEEIIYKNIYPDIDMRYHSDAGKLKYDFIIHPGGNLSSIAMQFSGPGLSIKDKELIIKTPVGELKELYPYSYQTTGNGRQQVDCKYVLKNNILTFSVKDYDPGQDLIIDPTIIFSSFSGSSADNWGYTATPGHDGSMYAGGIVFADPPATGFPVTPGAFQTTYGGGPDENGFPGFDIAVFKYTPSGNNRTYATYLGGSGNEQPHSLIEDGQGNLIIAGRTNSNNFPATTHIGPGGGYDIFITKLSPSGSGLIGSVVIGGSSNDGVNIRPKYTAPMGTDGIRRNYGDDARSEVIYDATGNIILASCTQSNNFPIAGGNIQSTFGNGRQDGVILKFNYNLSSYIFGDYFGGSGDDACFVTSINPLTGNIYVAGATTSTNLPGDKTSVIGNSFNGGETDGFVTEIAPDGSGIIKTSYIGTGGADMIYGLKFDKLGFPYIMGTTTGSWPVLNANFVIPNSGQFISKLKPDLSGFVYSTVFGTGGFAPNISPIAFLVDRCQNVYVSGWGGGLNKGQGYQTGTTFGLPEVDPLPGLQNFPPDGQDFYFFVLEKNANSQLFGSHFGQNGGLGDHVDGGTSRFDNNGVIYQAMCSNCGNDVAFPTTPNAVEPHNRSSGCNEAVVKIKMNYAGVGAGVQAEINNIVNDTSGCVPLVVSFRDTLALGITYYWDFGDNVRDTTTTLNIVHTFNDVGHYHVMLIAEDLSTCNERDTSYVTIRAGNNVATLNFTAVKDTPCTSTTYTFYNNSTPLFPPNFSPQSFTWDYGDGSAPDMVYNGRHTFPGPGIYHVVLSLSDTNYCNSPIELPLDLRVFPLVKAAFVTPQLGCAPYSANFKFTGGLAGTDFFWSFGDGTHSTDSTEQNPVHYYSNPGVYAVQLIVRDTNTCNKVDTSAYFNITVLEKPVARFSWAPNPPQRNTATQFTNLSTGAVRYLWDFGEDGETSTEVNPRHQFNSTTTFTVTLTAYNQNNCDSTVSLVVNALVDPLLDVPNAFTPGRFGEDGFVAVKGYGIRKMDWKIYNRWGQLVYHTTNRKQSWDGMYKGKLLPTDVYAYTLDVVFTDNKTLRKTGDITLLR